MIETIKNLGLMMNDEMEDIIDVWGDSDKLKELRTILDNEGYIDDGKVFNDICGTDIPLATETISRILINTVDDVNGYIAIA